MRLQKCITEHPCQSLSWCDYKSVSPDIHVNPWTDVVAKVYRRTSMSILELMWLQCWAIHPLRFRWAQKMVEMAPRTRTWEFRNSMRNTIRKLGMIVSVYGLCSLRFGLVPTEIWPRQVSLNFSARAYLRSTHFFLNVSWIRALAVLLVLKGLH